MNLQERIKFAIRDVPDFPKPGILFKDITPLLKDAALNRDITEKLSDYWSKVEVGVIIGIESRGFFWGNSLAQALGVPFVIARKMGKLPADTYTYTYELEYGSAAIEIHKDAIAIGDRAMIHDDLLATGGTAGAVAELVKMAGGQIAGFSFLLALEFLNGKEVIQKYSRKIHYLASY
ncbi:MAG: adenine phosphoribosyltransferase [Ekhidna sp.]|nr:adenine phosphoribosyltransferase [Ekhidna sp.]